MRLPCGRSLNDARISYRPGQIADRRRRKRMQRAFILIKPLLQRNKGAGLC
jgi:hypothetical protein